MDKIEQLKTASFDEIAGLIDEIMGPKQCNSWGSYNEAYSKVEPILKDRFSTKVSREDYKAFMEAYRPIVIKRAVFPWFRADAVTNLLVAPFDAHPYRPIEDYLYGHRSTLPYPHDTVTCQYEMPSGRPCLAQFQSKRGLDAHIRRVHTHNPMPKNAAAFSVRDLYRLVLETYAPGSPQFTDTELSGQPDWILCPTRIATKLPAELLNRSAVAVCPMFSNRQSRSFGTQHKSFLYIKCANDNVHEALHTIFYKSERRERILKAIRSSKITDKEVLISTLPLIIASTVV